MDGAGSVGAFDEVVSVQRVLLGPSLPALPRNHWLLGVHVFMSFDPKPYSLTGPFLPFYAAWPTA